MPHEQESQCGFQIPSLSADFLLAIPPLWCGSFKSQCTSQALAKPWRRVNGQALLPAREGCCIVAAGDTHRIIFSYGLAKMALAGLTLARSHLFHFISGNVVHHRARHLSIHFDEN